MRLIRHPRFQRALVFLLGCLLLLGGWGGFQADRALRNGVTTSALVIGIDLGRETVYQIRFVTATGEDVSTKTSFELPGSQVGDEIAVIYDPQDPTTAAQVGSMSSGWILWAGWLVSGFVLMGGSTISRFWRGPQPDEVQPR